MDESQNAGTSVNRRTSANQHSNSNTIDLLSGSVGALRVDLMDQTIRIMVSALLMVTLVVSFPQPAAADELQQLSDVELRDRIKKAMAQGCDYLRRTQKSDGSWSRKREKYADRQIALTSLAILAQINCDIPVESPEIQNGLNYLRQLPPSQPRQVYDLSLLIMALAAAEQYDRDLSRIRLLAGRLEKMQQQEGITSGLWGYTADKNHPDRSNGQYAVLALRDAAYAGVEVSQKTWLLAHENFTKLQAPDGGWTYEAGGGSPSGSMTAAGISTVAITTRMLHDDSDVDAQGRLDCCASRPAGTAIEKSRQWMARNFTIRENPNGGIDLGRRVYYYLYGLERAGRFSNSRFFGPHDWYRRGAEFLLEEQEASGHWISLYTEENDSTMCTAMALLFLSKGLSRVVLNKLDYTSARGDVQEQGEWNRHPLDVINLVDLIDSLPGWPPRLTTQTVTLNALQPETAVSDLNQAPVLFMAGRDAPAFSDEHLRWLREYIDAGGFLFASANCDRAGFDEGFRNLIPRMFPRGEASLKRLTAEHPVFRSEYLLNAETVELWGVDFGCRTAIIYSPDDIGCLWQKWQRHAPPDRNTDLTQRIIRGTSIGVNVLAYATGREPPEKLNDSGDRSGEPAARIDRGLLQIAKLRYSGSWNTAPAALRNLLKALNNTAGTMAAAQNEVVPVTLEEMSRFPLVYMHGRDRFQLSAAQTDSLRDYLNRGGFLFADACCGSAGFDRSFRNLIEQLFPDQPLMQVPISHEVFSDVIGEDIRQVTRRRLIPGEKDASLKTVIETVPPFLEGIEIDGRLAIIYSKYDISCALEHQAALSCDGYAQKDAVRIAVNVVMYALLHNVSWAPLIAEPPAGIQH
jgi:hypothetical protein